MRRDGQGRLVNVAQGVLVLSGLATTSDTAPAQYVDFVQQDEFCTRTEATLLQTERSTSLPDQESAGNLFFSYMNKMPGNAKKRCLS